MKMGNPFKINRMADLMQQANQLRQNPNMIKDMLLNGGRITQEQYNALKDMNTPSQIGQYLLNNGIIGQDRMNELAQAAQHIQNMMNQGGTK